MIYDYYLRAATIAKDSLKDAVTVQGWILNSTLRYSAFLESTLRAYVMQRGLFTIIGFSIDDTIKVLFSQTGTTHQSHHQRGCNQ